MAWRRETRVLQIHHVALDPQRDWANHLERLRTLFIANIVSFNPSGQGIVFVGPLDRGWFIVPS
jgi:hypothetical protein